MPTHQPYSAQLMQNQQNNIPLLLQAVKQNNGQIVYVPVDLNKLMMPPLISQLNYQLI